MTNPTGYEPYLLKDVRQASAKKLFNVVSTFAGGGGSSTNGPQSGNGYNGGSGVVIIAYKYQ